MTILRFQVVVATIFIKINSSNRKTRPYSQFNSLVTSKYVPLSEEILILNEIFRFSASLSSRIKISLIIQVS